MNESNFCFMQRRLHAQFITVCLKTRCSEQDDRDMNLIVGTESFLFFLVFQESYK